MNQLRDLVVRDYVRAAVDAVLGSCRGYERRTANGLIDPSGTVFDRNGNPVSGATVMILRSESADGPFAIVDPSSPRDLTGDEPGDDDRGRDLHWDVLRASTR